MTTPLRTSPVFELLNAQAHPLWLQANAMQYAQTIANEASASARIGIGDVSFLPRFGVKGPHAAAWLAGYGLPVPGAANSWSPLPGGGLVARLGLSEFLVEHAPQLPLVQRLADAAAATTAPGVYPVAREDAAFVLLGPLADDLLRQTCNINFRALDLNTRPVVLTSMAGIGVTVLPGVRDGVPRYRVWCDYTFGAYLWRTLLEIAVESGGGAVGAGLCLD